jgi:mono/diheme cytochrome c family protein
MGMRKSRKNTFVNTFVYAFILTGLVLGLSGCGGASDKNTNVNNGNKVGGGDTTAAGDPIKGEIVYTNNCLPCHGKGGENGHNGPNLKQSEIAKDPKQIYDRVMNGKGGMPSFKDTLSQVQIQDVVAYVNQVIAGK